MNNRLYKMMNWVFIEEVIYSECDRPQELLGPHTKGNSTLVQAFFPGAASVVVSWNEKGKPSAKPVETRMELADDDGFFAALLPTKELGMYRYAVTYEERDEGGKTLKKRVVKQGDPYRHKQVLTKSDLDKIAAGTHPHLAEKLGANPMELSGERGVHFAIWAPNAQRVSVIGDWNGWDGRLCQMKRLGDSGVFELFVPDVKKGDKYQFELKLHGGVLRRVADPLARISEDPGEGICAVDEPGSFHWTDGAFVKGRAKFQTGNAPVSIFEVYPGDYVTDGKESALRRMASPLAKLAKERGYTHIELLPVMERGREDARGFCTFGYFATASDYGTPEDLEYLVNELHRAGVGVILDWIPAYFAPDAHGLAALDGTCLYEHQDPRQGIWADLGTRIFNYGRPQVRNFLIAGAAYWVRRFHLDGLRTAGVARMLYLDYGRSEWIPNLYGGNENLEAIDFLREMNAAVKRQDRAVMSIAEDSSAHPKITDDPLDGGLGFDLKWNSALTEEYLQFIGQDPLFRGRSLTHLNDGMVYAFVEKFLLAFPWTRLGGDEDSVLACFPGDEEQKKAAFRLSLAYLYTHPGRKMLGQEFDARIGSLITDLNKLYRSEPALSRMDEDPGCFEWLSSMNTEQSCISYLRKTDDPEEMLMAVVNFSGAEQEFTTGVPYEGKYQEILSTDAVAYGGGSAPARTVLRATDQACDGRTQSLTLKLPAQTLILYRFIPYTEEELEKVIAERIRSYTPIKRTAGEKAVIGKKTAGRPARGASGKAQASAASGRSASGRKSEVKHTKSPSSGKSTSKRATTKPAKGGVANRPRKG